MFSENEANVLSKDLAAFRYLANTQANSLQGFLTSHERLIADYKSLLSDYEETKEARDRYKRQARGGEGVPFVVVLIDGDSYPFDDALVQKAAEGGTRAAQMLFAAFMEHIRKMGLAPDTRLIVRYIVNLAEASRFFHQIQLTGSHSRSLATFTAAFSSAFPLFDVIDSGDKPSTTDAKIRDNFDLYVNSSACKHIFFAGCNTQRNLELLKPFEKRSERITLIRNSQSWQQFSAIGLRTEELMGIFREGRPPSPDKSSTQSSARPTKYVPPAQRSSTEDVLQHAGPQRPTTAMSQHPLPRQAQTPVMAARTPTTNAKKSRTELREPEVDAEIEPIQPRHHRDQETTPRPRRSRQAPEEDQGYYETEYRRRHQQDTDRDPEYRQHDYSRDHKSGRRDTYNTESDDHIGASDEYSGPNAETSDEYSQADQWNGSGQYRNRSFSSDFVRGQQRHHKPKEQPPICTHWIRGICKYGDTCHKRHEVPPDPRGPGLLDSYGPGRAATSSDWRTPAPPLEQGLTEQRVPSRPTPALGQRGSTTHGRAFPEVEEGWDNCVDLNDVVSSLPRRSDGSRDLIPVNRVEWRLDYYPGAPPSKNDMASFEERLRVFPPCYDFHLKGKCKEGAHCPKDHNELDPNLVDVMRWIAHDSPCKLQGACRDRDCALAHICYNPNCNNGVKFTGCRLPSALHHVNPHVMNYVPAVVPHEELSEEDRALAGQPIEVIEGDLLGVEDEQPKPINKQNMTSRWAQNMPNPHQSGNNTPIRASHDESPLIPADDGPPRQSTTPTRQMNGSTSWDPYMPSPTHSKKLSAPNGNEGRDELDRGRSTPRRTKYSFEPASSSSASENHVHNSHDGVATSLDDRNQPSHFAASYEDNERHAPTPRPLQSQRQHDSEQYTATAQDGNSQDEFDTDNSGSRTPPVPGWTTLEVSGAGKAVVNGSNGPVRKFDTPQATQERTSSSAKVVESRQGTPASVRPVERMEAPSKLASPPARKLTIADAADARTSGPEGEVTDSQVENEPLSKTRGKSPANAQSFASTGPAEETVDELFDTESRTPTHRSPLPAVAQPVKAPSAVPSIEAKTADDAEQARRPAPISRPASKASARLNVTASAFVPGTSSIADATGHTGASQQSPTSTSTATKSSPEEVKPASPLADSKYAPKSPTVSDAPPKATQKSKSKGLSGSHTLDKPTLAANAQEGKIAIDEPTSQEIPAAQAAMKSHSRTASSTTAVRGDHGKMDGWGTRNATRARMMAESGDARHYDPDAAQQGEEGEAGGDGAFGDGKPGGYDSWKPSRQGHEGGQGGQWGYGRQGQGGYEGQGQQWGYAQSGEHGWNQWGNGGGGGGWQGNGGRGSYGQHIRSDASGYGRGRGWSGNEGYAGHGGGYGGNGYESGQGYASAQNDLYYGFDIKEDHAEQEEMELFAPPPSGAKGTSSAWTENTW
ncbi:hypothetical protein CAC42_1035 [Sphaceloma murrayae]|uniref:C3H1-type domain-containing protein n=1 Tax=Sphaceloma murrayae TaxID=2082308 RepID=A0A2K1R1U2_9PEZI|nr:hypothetical protein CAC42_1035 [Sphaceloma murrayae]